MDKTYSWSCNSEYDDTLSRKKFLCIIRTPTYYISLEKCVLYTDISYINLVKYRLMLRYNKTKNRVLKERKLISKLTKLEWKSRNE